MMGGVQKVNNRTDPDNVIVVHIRDNIINFISDNVKYLFTLSFIWAIILAIFRNANLYVIKLCSGVPHNDAATNILQGSPY